MAIRSSTPTNSIQTVVEQQDKDIQMLQDSCTRVERALKSRSLLVRKLQEKVDQFEQILNADRASLISNSSTSNTVLAVLQAPATQSHADKNMQI